MDDDNLFESTGHGGWPSRHLDDAFYVDGESPHSWARAYQHSYSCCVYNTRYADFCLITDQDCIDEYNRSYGEFYLIVGIVVALLISSCSITFLCLYCRSKKKEREESYKKKAKSERTKDETERKIKDFDLSNQSSLTSE